MNTADLTRALTNRGIVVIASHLLSGDETVSIPFDPQHGKAPDFTEHRGVFVRQNGQVWVLAASGTVGYETLDDGEVTDETTAALDVLGELLAPAPEPDPEPVEPKPVKAVAKRTKVRK
jgi:hypothetical protein